MVQTQPGQGAGCSECRMENRLVLSKKGREREVGNKTEQRASRQITKACQSYVKEFGFHSVDSGNDRNVNTEIICFLLCYEYFGRIDLDGSE